MKKICVIVTLVMVVIMTSCGGRLEKMEELTVYTTEKADEMNEKIKDCVNNNDAEGLTALFAENVQDEKASLETEAREMIEAFHGNIIVEIDGGEPGLSGSKETPPFDFGGLYTMTLSSGEQYDMWMSLRDFDEDENEIGLIQIQMCNCLQEDLPEGFRFESVGREYAGIYVYEY